MYKCFLFANCSSHQATHIPLWQLFSSVTFISFYFLSANFAPAGKTADTALCLQYIFNAYCFGKLSHVTETLTRFSCSTENYCSLIFHVCCVYVAYLVPVPEGTATKIWRKSLLNRQNWGKALLFTGLRKLLGICKELIRFKFEVKGHLRQTSASKNR